MSAAGSWQACELDFHTGRSSAARIGGMIAAVANPIAGGIHLINTEFTRRIS
jgi:hypothetical protein